MNEHKGSITWQDGTHDHTRSCSECHSPLCQYPTHYPERYREVTTASYLNLDPEAAEAVNSNPDVATELDAIMPFKLSSELEVVAKEAFESLTDKQQEVWIYVMRQGMSQEQTAERLGITKAAVNDRLEGAKSKFTAFIQERMA